MEEKAKNFDQLHLDPGNNSILKQEVSDIDVEYITDNNYPFIQLINPEAEFGKEFNLRLINTANGWVIHDYGGAVSTSAPHSKDNGNACSIPNQLQVAKEITKIIKGWPSVELIAGTPMLEFLLLTEANINLIGYTPSKEREKRYEFLRKQGLVVGSPKKPALTTVTTAR